MGMRSEYQKHFKVSALRKSLPLYYENVAFRTARRDREYAHTPLSWYTEDKNDDESVDSDREADSGSDMNSDSQQLKSGMKKRLEAGREECSDDDDEPPESLAVHDEQASSSPVSAEREHLPTTPTVDVNGTDSRMRKQRRPDRRQKIPCPVSKLHTPVSGKKQPQVKSSKRSTTSTGLRSAASPSSRLRSRTPAAQPEVEHPAPFLSYGWAGAGRNLSQHKTFNIRATADVYPAALRAHSRRATAAQQRVASAIQMKEDRVQALLNSAANERAKHEIEWTSEYRQQYPAYSVGEYSRSLSARAHDRKLCRVVYVS
ncbi:centriole, cilia and spindle-associated protein-like [Haliotis rufescens]|uniref:centriole, cilia and spindle-associated protein-like n=1 Tax=Haliotis rufescens TaxID=6454 RepID=UPI00201F6A8C|nr:centriole, cilia and spindle-associated protein-like [Haliotis rufescens]XP_046364225.2 centriole, cilia and spindle-associated protein-like [Haliotis rufescens]XP_046364226.2 centriole, cilia and spindle-associated protein-like [Haliotis rufescens]